MAIPPPNSVAYRRQLETVRDQFAPDVEEAVILGADMAQFVLATKGTRSAGVSWSDEGIYVEFWEGDNERNESIHPTYQEAIEAAKKWLAC